MMCTADVAKRMKKSAKRKTNEFWSTVNIPLFDGASLPICSGGGGGGGNIVVVNEWCTTRRPACFLPACLLF